MDGIISDDDGNDETESYWDSVQETYLPIRDQPDPVAESQVSHQTLDAQPVDPPHAVPTTSQQSNQVSDIQEVSQPSPVPAADIAALEQCAYIPQVEIKPNLPNISSMLPYQLKTPPKY